MKSNIMVWLRDVTELKACVFVKDVTVAVLVGG